MFEKQVHKVECIDATPKTNQYKFLLINTVVPDKFNKGYPVVHLISNREDELVLIPFFQAIKERCSNPNLEINVVMTDVDNFGWNAFSRVFGDCNQLLCKQHVKRAWIKKYHFVEASNCKKNYTRHWKLSYKRKHRQKYFWKLSQRKHRQQHLRKCLSDS